MKLTIRKDWFGENHYVLKIKDKKTLNYFEDVSSLWFEIDKESKKWYEVIFDMDVNETDIMKDLNRYHLGLDKKGFLVRNDIR